jgi:hypothetical protein
VVADVQPTAVQGVQAQVKVPVIGAMITTDSSTHRLDDAQPVTQTAPVCAQPWELTSAMVVANQDTLRILSPIDVNSKCKSVLQTVQLVLKPDLGCVIGATRTTDLRATNDVLHVILTARMVAPIEVLTIVMAVANQGDLPTTLILGDAFL